MSNIVYLEDCMKGLPKYPDKCFDLAIVDPPYRNASENRPTKDMRKNGFISEFGEKPTKEYFDQLFRVSKNQIIFGANNFECLPIYKGFIVWRKTSIPEAFTMSMAELAFISEGLGTISKVFDCSPTGTKEDPRIHPTQKPVALYEWLLNNYAKQGDKILDTHVGSGSSRIAAYNLGYDFTGYEIDPIYWEAQEKRFREHAQQINLFVDEVTV